MTYRYSLVLSIIISIFNFAKAQSTSHIDSLYENAVKHYQQKKTDSAILQFEKVIFSNPGHRDATFNLAAIYYELGNKKRAIELFQACVKLKDREAASILKNQLSEPILYDDTMHIEDIDILPKLLVKSQPQEIIIEGHLNKKIIDKILSDFRSSKTFKREIGPTSRLTLSLFFGKDGKMDARTIFNNPALQAEITAILQGITIIPGKYQNKEVVTYGLRQPINFD